MGHVASSSKNIFSTSNINRHFITDHIDIWTSAIKAKSAAGRGSSKKLDLYGIKKLRGLILELAVRGKLVPQDPNDEPVNELLKRITEVKVQLIADKKIKAQKTLPGITDEEKPFELHNGWKLVYLQDLCCFENGDRSSRYPNKDDLVNIGIPFFGAPDINDEKLEFGSYLRFISPVKLIELSNGKLEDRDFVMLLRGTVGKVAQFKANQEHSTGFINAQMLIVRFLEMITAK